MDMDSTKKLYNWIYWSMMALCLSLYFFLLWRRVLPKVLSDYSIIFILLADFVIRRIAAAVCKSFGSSQEGAIVELYQRGVGASSNVSNVKVEVPKDGPTTKLWVGLAGLALCGIFGVGTVFWIINPADDKDMTSKWAAPLGLLFCGGVVLLYFVLSSKTYQLADDRGVHGCTMPFLQEKIVPWPEIQQMEIKTKRDTLGEVTSVTAVLKNGANVEQARVFLQFVPVETRNQFLQAVIEKAGLQKST